MSSKQKDLSIKEKKGLLVRFFKLEKCSQREAALVLKIPQFTINNILKNREEFGDEIGLYYRSLSDFAFIFNGNTINGCKKQMQSLLILQPYWLVT